MTCYLKEQLAAAGTDCKVHIVQRGAVGPLIEMLQSPEAQLKEMSAFALGRLAKIFRALSYIHGTIRVCHRDIKPQNLLINPHTYQVKLCDFGSAKVLIKGDPNISYFCSRYYRAPELIDLARDTLVTMKIGTYKGDLAKVVDLDNARQRVTVKLIPRIELPTLANKLEGREAPKKTTFTPPPRIFNVD